MTSTQRTLLIAVIVAILLGLAGGWLVRTWTEATLEDRAHEAVKGAEQRNRELVR